MDNANKEVQAEANFVTDSNEEEGFAHAIEKFVLIRISSPSRDFLVCCHPRWIFWVLRRRRLRPAAGTL